jgi:hypothetical protein
MSPCDFWFFGMLKGALKDYQFNSSDGIEKAITKDKRIINERMNNNRIINGMIIPVLNRK